MIGNCLCGAIWIWLRKGGRIKPCWTRHGPHFLVRTRTGEIWHWIVTKDVFPPPLCWLAHFGRCEKHRDRIARAEVSA